MSEKKGDIVFFSSIYLLSKDGTIEDRVEVNEKKVETIFFRIFQNFFLYCPDEKDRAIGYSVRMSEKEVYVVFFMYLFSVQTREMGLLELVLRRVRGRYKLFNR